MRALERSWERAGLTSVRNEQGLCIEFLSKLLAKVRLLRRFGRTGQPILVAFMGYSESRTFPQCFAREFIPYCFDCWPRNYPRWKSFFRRHKVRLAFFTARQSAEYFAARLPGTVCVWLPEAIDHAEYSAGPPLASRSIDVLELGRKFDSYHAAIATELSAQRRVHLFEKQKGNIIFATKHDLVEGLAQSRISVCFPCSMTHPERSGTVETLTLRYLESIASRCLIVGKCPAELLDLFGYNPVVESDSAKPAEQLSEVLKNINQYQQFVDRNYDRLLNVGTWDCRVAQMLQATSANFETARSSLSPEELVGRRI